MDSAIQGTFRYNNSSLWRSRPEGEPRASPLKEPELREQSTEFIRTLREALEEGRGAEILGPRWGPLRELLARISR
jgi:hypothetical protein